METNRQRGLVSFRLKFKLLYFVPRGRFCLQYRVLDDAFRVVMVIVEFGTEPPCHNEDTLCKAVFVKGPGFQCKGKHQLRKVITFINTVLDCPEDMSIIVK